MMRHRLVLLVSFLILSVHGVCQDTVGEFMRSDGKINVVVAVLVVIFILLIAYLISIDRRVRRMENQKHHGKKEL
jgi:exosortase/archaeosortase